MEQNGFVGLQFENLSLSFTLNLIESLKLGLGERHVVYSLNVDAISQTENPLAQLSLFYF